MFRTYWKALAVFVACSQTLLSQQLIQYKLKVNDTYKIMQVADQDIVQKIQGVKHNMKSHIEGDFHFKVKQVTDSSYIILFKFDRFKMSSTSSLYGSIADIDTSVSAKDNIESQIFSALTSKTLTMEMLKNGKIKYVTGTDALLDAMVSKAGVDNEFSKAVLKESMKKEFGSESLANSFEQMTYVYSVKPVKVGTTWSNEFKGDMSSKNKWQLNKLTDNIDISGTGKVSFISSDESNHMDLSGEQNTSLKADKNSGFVKDMQVKSVMNGKTKLKYANNVEVPTSITTITTYKSTRYVQ